MQNIAEASRTYAEKPSFELKAQCRECSTHWEVPLGCTDFQCKCGCSVNTWAAHYEVVGKVKVSTLPASEHPSDHQAAMRTPPVQEAQGLVEGRLQRKTEAGSRFDEYITYYIFSRTVWLKHSNVASQRDQNEESVRPMQATEHRGRVLENTRAAVTKAPEPPSARPIYADYVRAHPQNFKTCQGHPPLAGTQCLPNSDLAHGQQHPCVLTSRCVQQI
jgi:hypothetical protein